MSLHCHLNIHICFFVDPNISPGHEYVLDVAVFRRDLASNRDYIELMKSACCLMLTGTSIPHISTSTDPNADFIILFRMLSHWLWNQSTDVRIESWRSSDYSNRDIQVK